MISVANEEKKQKPKPPTKPNKKPAHNLRGMSLFKWKNWRKADVASPKKHEREIPCCLIQNFRQSQTLPPGAAPAAVPSCAQAGLGSQAVRVPGCRAYCTPSLQHPRIFNLSTAQSSLHLFLSSIIKLSLLFWFKSFSELSELKINPSALGNTQPPGSRKHFFLFSARHGNSAFRITHGNFDCHFASPHPANSHFHFQK